ncbi:MAG: hypothetical protein QME71_07335 [Dehalococcoidia bacterium]|nr:hypothetical protein [Dehalococcoidia bacterium]
MVVSMDDVLGQIEEKEGLLIGPWRQPVNRSIDLKGSIHDDEAAGRLGFRGGTVAGSIHSELFPPLLLKAFGQRWFERGNLSLYFLEATTDREEVRAVVAAPPAGAADAQVQVWGKRPNGNRIGEGTAAAGSPDAVSALLARDLNRFPPGELRILAPSAVGDRFPEVEVSVTQEAIEERLRLSTDPLPWYAGPSPWGGAIATTCNMVDVMWLALVAYLAEKEIGEAVPLYGAIELRNVNGPVFVARPYVAGGEVINLGQTAKTEYLWFDSYLNEKDGRRVAEMRMMYRFMKDSSPLYA